MTKYLKPWVLAVVGSALVLFSTVISGYWIYEIQNRIDDAKERIATKERALDQSYRERDQASMVSTLALLQNKLTKTTTTDVKVLNAWDDVLAKSLMEANIRLAVAAGKESDLSISEKVTKAMLVASKGDGGIASYDVMIFLLKEGGTYEKKLKNEILKLSEERKVLDKRKNLLYFAGLVFQVIGLILLLFKEAPVIRQSSTQSKQA